MLLISQHGKSQGHARFIPLNENITFMKVLIGVMGKDLGDLSTFPLNCIALHQYGWFHGRYLWCPWYVVFPNMRKYHESTCGPQIGQPSHPFVWHLDNKPYVGKSCMVNMTIAHSRKWHSPNGCNTSIPTQNSCNFFIIGVKYTFAFALHGDSLLGMNNKSISEISFCCEPRKQIIT